MKLTFFILFSVSLMTTVAQVKDTLPVNKLSGLVGKWTVKGMEDRFIEICDMYKGGYFMVCNSEQKTKSGKITTG